MVAAVLAVLAFTTILAILALLARAFLSISIHFVSRPIQIRIQPNFFTAPQTENGTSPTSQ